MMINSRKIYSKFLIFACLMVLGCSTDSPEPQKVAKQDNLKREPAGKFTEIDMTSLNSVCDCSDQALQIMEEILLVRNQFENLEAYKSDQESVSRVKALIGKWQQLQSYCMQTFQREMLDDSDCNKPTVLADKRKNLFDLGIQT